MTTATFLEKLRAIVPLTDEQAALVENLHKDDNAPTQERNGVTRPKSGVTERVWEIADKITYLNKDQGKPPASKAEVVAVATHEGIKEATALSSYSAWCKFFEINAKDPSKPYVHKERKAKVDESPEPEAEVEVPVVPAAAEFAAPAPAPTYAPPPPLPVYLPPAPLPT